MFKIWGDAVKVVFTGKSITLKCRFLSEEILRVLQKAIKQNMSVEKK